ncbi:large subunit ribosomal protein L21 [Desulfurobacterium pacificum]|jgi:large subunit ribosomal protein L21|uniref:Large ribosomal subunit protein bL21 n=1 Tax=Desulfurobacterium pacificum TaxID=240166 RepID=A0ABY1NIS2_9BACT|nr:50S ribosomal protein L21 [Desulfurobacterium pacificum]SMP10405.1 large subunit ribosomal protein L21 [Desulfurobacterium pacificum]
MYAVIKTGGKQYVVEPGQVLKVEKINLPEGSEVEFDALMVRDENGVKVGDEVKGAKVKATVVRHGKGKKIIVFKYKKKKHYQRKYGHRQHFTEIQINEVVS